MGKETFMRCSAGCSKWTIEGLRALTTHSLILQAVLSQRRVKLKDKWNTRLPSWGCLLPQQTDYWQSPLWSFKNLTNQPKQKEKMYNGCQVSSLCSCLPGESTHLPPTWVSHTQLSQPNLSQSGVLAHTKFTTSISLWQLQSGSFICSQCLVIECWVLLGAMNLTQTIFIPFKNLARSVLSRPERLRALTWVLDYLQ